jgi:4'-phosphopantetheinyl transferase
VILWPVAGPEEAIRSEESIDVWCAALELPEAELARLEATLAPEERARAARFVFERDRSRFVAARGLLRQILAAYVGTPPEALRFRYSARGKPALEVGEAGLEFNLAHSGGLALYAVAWRRPVGVDVERLREDIDVEGIAGRFFSPREAAALRAMPQAERLPAFFRCWTRKEALLKAWGEGLPFGLDRFSVSLDSPQAAIVETPLDAREAAEWRLWPLEPAPGYVGALAVRGSAGRVRCLEWRPRSRRAGLRAGGGLQ